MNDIHDIGEAELRNPEAQVAGEVYDRLIAAVVRETGSITAGFTAHGVADYTRRESRITAELPSAEVAAQLRQPTSRPVLQVESLNVDLAGTPIEWARAWFAGDRVKLAIDHN